MTKNVMISEEFFELAFSLLIRFMRQSARLLFERASEQENCLFFLFDPGKFCREMPLFRDRCLPISNALRLFLRYHPAYYRDFLRDYQRFCSVCDTDPFLSPFTFSGGKDDFCYRLID